MNLICNYPLFLRRRRGGNAANSVVTWDASADTYTQTIYQVDQSKVTWDASADTYTQELYTP